MAIREKLAEKGVGADKDFQWRGGDVSRIEGFSDAVFAFSITLLVVSLLIVSLLEGLWGIILSGWIYALIGPAQAVHGVWARKKGERLKRC